MQLHQLPDSISALTKLRALSVASNRLWQLPAGISHCSALRLLDCSHNQLGKLPQKLSQLVSLRSLKLTHNRHVLVVTTGCTELDPAAGGSSLARCKRTGAYDALRMHHGCDVCCHVSHV